MRRKLNPDLVICAGLVAITWAVFGQTIRHQFVNYDDPQYVFDNPFVRAGLSWPGMAWAFSHVHSQNWHPLTTLAHMLDCQLFGLQPGWHHLVNVLLHAAAVIVLFVTLRRATARPWASAGVAALFAIHPLRAESVAWIAERKDVLSGLFFMLTLMSYVAYVRRPSIGRYLTMSILFACGLMSKPMLVSVPIILLLLDYWPLKRFGQSSASKLIQEKIPLGILSVASAVVTLFVQNTGIGLIRLDVLPFSWRIANALSACFVYIRQMIWPVDLAPAYSHPALLPAWQVAVLAAAMLAVTLVVFALRKRRPYLMVGWFWYLIMLLPVIGLVQVGGQSHSDRYTYLPQIGLGIAAMWLIADLAGSWRHSAPVLGAAAGMILGGLALTAARQVGYWHDSETLWRRALAVTTQNDLAHMSLGQFLSDQKRMDEAIPEYEAAARIGPPNPDVETMLANLLLKQGRIDEALQYYRHVVQLQPDSALAHYNLAVGFHRRGALPEAITHYKEALAIAPNYPDAEHFLGEALLQSGQPEEAKLHMEKR